MSKFIKLNGETYKRIDDLDEEKPSLKPKKEDKYWTILSNGELCDVKFYGGEESQGEYEIGNFYKNRREAEQKVEELKAIQRVKEYIVNEFGYLPTKWADWNNECQYKYDIFWRESKIRCSWTTLTKFYSPIGYLKTEEQAKQLIKDKKEDLETIYKPK